MLVLTVHVSTSIHHDITHKIANTILYNRLTEACDARWRFND